MKFRVSISIIALLISVSINAQRQNRIGYIDMDYILENLADYTEANAELDYKINEWKKEIDFRRQKIQDMKDELENERPLLTQDLIDERQDEIDYEQHRLIAYQQKRFGPEGDMRERRKQIIQPIQDQVFNAIQEIGENREYDFIFDSSADALMLFSARRHDISDQVLAVIDRKSAQAMRQRARKDRTDPADNDFTDETKYKSVSQAREDREKREERDTARAEKDEARKTRLNERQRRRDSIRDARAKEYDERRQEILEERDLKRNPEIKKEVTQADSLNTEKTKRNAEEFNAENQQDSIQQAQKTNAEDKRKATIEKRKERIQARRDSIDQARKEKIEQRQKRQDSLKRARQKVKEKD